MVDTTKTPRRRLLRLDLSGLFGSHEVVVPVGAQFLTARPEHKTLACWFLYRDVGQAKTTRRVHVVPAMSGGDAPAGELVGSFLDNPSIPSSVFFVFQESGDEPAARA